MKVKLFAMRDTKVNTFGKLFPFQNDEEAVRAFSKAVSGGDQLMTEWPEDYTLFRVGTFDDDIGEITPEAPFRIINGLEGVQLYKAAQERLAAAKEVINQEGGNLNA